MPRLRRTSASDTERSVRLLRADQTRQHPARGVDEVGEPAILLATKSVPPAIRAQVIERAALIGRLSEEPARKLTLLSAPAGWGKTTLLAQWMSRAANDSHRLGWLTLDRSDNDPVRFWACALAALQKACPGCRVGPPWRRNP